MGYKGVVIGVPLGQQGLQTDDPMMQIAPSAAIKANNVTLHASKVEKARGSMIYSEKDLGDAIVGVHDWWPTASDQRLIAATDGGEIYRDTGNGFWGGASISDAAVPLEYPEVQTITFSAVSTTGSLKFLFTAGATALINWDATTAEIQTIVRAVTGHSGVIVTGNIAPLAKVRIVFAGRTGNQALIAFSDNTLERSGSPVTPTAVETSAYGTSLGTLTPTLHFTPGGAETALRARKLFIFTGVGLPHVIDGDTAAARVIANPAADWSTGNFPTYGIIYQSRLVVLAGHRVYLSAVADHEDFALGSGGTGEFQQYAVFAGEGDALISAVVHKGLLLLFKRPFGVYVLDWRDPSATYPTISKYSDAFGAASPHAFVNMLNDLVGGSNSGTLNSLEATAAHGSLEAGDILNNTRTRDHIRQELHPSGIPYMHAIYYPEKECAYFTGRSSVASLQDRMIVMDISRERPRITLETKDQANCLALRRDGNNILRPIYGSDDGNVYLMDQDARNVGGAAYVGEFQSPFIDFSHADGSLSGKTKIFDFLSLTYTATGTWSFYVDVYIDGDFIETIPYRQTLGAVLGTFILDTSVLGASQTRTQRSPLHGSGKAISFRIYNNNVDEYFRVEACQVSFRIAGEQARSSKTKG